MLIVWVTAETWAEVLSAPQYESSQVTPLNNLKVRNGTPTLTWSTYSIVWVTTELGLKV